MSASKSSAAKSRGQRSTEETDSDDNSLKINLDKRPPRKRTRKALNDERLERTIQETINKCPNITPDAVKKMLLRLVKNEHVLALVSLQAEHDEQNKIKSSSSSLNSDDEQEIPIVPKFTRQKAKQLNKKPLGFGSLKKTEPDSEVVALIQDDLPEKSDDEDEEYVPGNDEIQSDEDQTMTTISDLDSQPSTPGCSLVEQDADTESPGKDSSGLFKLPKNPADIQEQENIIATRTRSKLCLTTTPIETIESNFVPPDMESGMYGDFEHEDIDCEWREFLNEFMKPLNCNNDEDDDDPTYVADRNVPIHKEELREVRVSKKELNELISELLEMDGMVDESIVQDHVDETLHPSLISPTTSRESGSKSKRHKTSLTPVLATTSDTQSNQSPTIFNPSSMSTPTTSKPCVKVIDTPPTTTVFIPNAKNQMELIQLPSQNFNILNSAFYNNGFLQLPQFQPIILQVPTLDLLQNRLNLSGSFSHSMQTPVKSLINLTDDCKNSMSYKESKLRKFQFLNQEAPPQQVIYNENAIGFTIYQKEVFDQQMRMHVQLLTQNFMQCYGHPVHWKEADNFKKHMNELRPLIKTQISPFNAKYIRECIKFCKRWERELTANDRENTKYIRYLHSEINREEKSIMNGSKFIGNFCERFMEKIVNSTLFIYPSLLPKVPFRKDSNKPAKKLDTQNSEISLIAFGLELFHDVLYNELNRYKPVKIRQPSVFKMCDYVSKYICPIRSKESLKRTVYEYKNDAQINPIKYYFLHHKSPAMRHMLENIDLNAVKPPKDHPRGTLPTLWDKHVFCNKRIGRVYYNLTPSASEESDIEEVEEQPEIQTEKSLYHFKIDLIARPLIKDIPLIDKANLFEIKIVHGEKPQINIKNLLESPVLIADSQICYFEESTQFTDFQEKSNEKTDLVSDFIPTSILRTSTSPSKKKSVRFELPTGKVRFSRFKSVKSNQKRYQNCPSKESFYQRFFLIIHKFEDAHEFDCVNSRLKKFYSWARAIDIYSKILKYTIVANEGMASPQIDGKITKNDESSKKFNKKLADNRALLIVPPSSPTEGISEMCLMDKDRHYAFNFLEKVQKVLNENGDDMLFDTLHATLKNFNTETESVPQLYHKLENIFLPKYADLLDLFLTFLLPEHAAEIGKFFEHFILTNMGKLLEKINAHFAKQPQHIKKIYACLNEMSNEVDITMEKVKTRVLPLLKGNQLLIDWFLQLFASETPPESGLNEYETIYLKKTICDDGLEHTEEVVIDASTSTSSNDDSTNATSCGVKYINGKIIYRGRTILPAKISFLAYDALNKTNESESNSLSDTENSGNFCVHEIRKHAQRPLVEKAEDPEVDVKKTKAELKKDKKKVRAVSKYKLCDAPTLRAHAIRLNPVVHGRNGEKYSDVVHLLTQTPPATPNGSSEITTNISSDEKSQSPKKINSKSSKKLTLSPTHQKKKSPIVAAAISPSLSELPTTSKALVTSKKLKNLIDNPDEGTCRKKLKVQEDDSMTPVTEYVPSWTRNEDKIILEEIKKGCSDKNEMMEKLDELIEGRDKSEIKKRYDFLLDIVSMMQPSKVH